jgi:hypothetical protein
MSYKTRSATNMMLQHLLQQMPDKEIDIILDFMSKTEDFLKRRVAAKK